jgi:hypothetical protein
MRIHSNKAFQFDHPQDASITFTVQAGAFSGAPDWVEDSIMFKLASQDGDVTVIESKQDEIGAETGDAKAAKAAAAAEAKAKKEAEAKAKAEEADALAKAANQ